MLTRALFNEFDASFLRDAATLVDLKLELLDREAQANTDPDALGIFDKSEYITGFGLVACQTFINACAARCNLSRKQALELGPRHQCGLSMATLINALANYWKHSSEWAQPLPKRAQETIDNISMLYPQHITASYLTTNALAVLLQPHRPRMERVTPFLIHWRDSLP